MLSTSSNQKSYTKSLEGVHRNHLIFDCGEVDSLQKSDFTVYLMEVHANFKKYEQEPTPINCYLPENVYERRLNITEFQRNCFPSKADQLRNNQIIRLFPDNHRIRRGVDFYYQLFCLYNTLRQMGAKFSPQMRFLTIFLAQTLN